MWNPKTGLTFDCESGRFPVAIRRRYPAPAYRKIDRQMPLLTLATQLFDALAQLAPRISDPLSAKVSGTPSASLNALAGAPEPNVGALRFLIPLGVIATTIAVVFFGLGFFLLAHPNEELIAGVGAGYGGVEGETRSPDLLSPLGKDVMPSKVLRELPDPAISPGLSASATDPSEAQAALPPANREMAWSALPTSPISVAVDRSNSTESWLVLTLLLVTALDRSSQTEFSGSETHRYAPPG